MLLLASILVGAFIFGTLLTDDADDDDDHQGGKMIPVTIPT